MLPGCLIDDPPPYQEPQQTPPRINSPKVAPPLNRVIVAQTGQTLVFTIPFSSEDAGEGLNAFVILDSQPVFGTTTLVAPSTLEDKDRLPISLTWPVRGVPAGCHSLTLRVGHVSNLYSPFAQASNPDDIAEEYWLMNVDVDPSLSSAVLNCPQASTGTPP